MVPGDVVVERAQTRRQLGEGDAERLHAASLAPIGAPQRRRLGHGRRRNGTGRRNGRGHGTIGGRPAATRRCLLRSPVHLLGEMAGNLVAARHLAEDRPFLDASFGVAESRPQPASGVEVAAGRRVRRARHVTGQDDPLAAALDDRVRDRHCRQQGDRVGMERAIVQIDGGRRFDEAAQVHNGYPVADVADDREVVGDEQVGQLELVLEAFEQVDDLGLDRDVQGADRFVGDDQIRVECQRPGNADPLALAAAEFVGIAVAVVRVEPDRRQQVANPLPALRALADVVNLERLRRRFRPPSSCGFRLAYGSWKIICIRRRTPRRVDPSAVVMS